MLVGDLSKLATWSARLSRLSSAATLESISRKLADESVAPAKDGFANSEDPFGNPWAPKVIDNGKPPGEASGATKRSLMVKRVSANGFTVGATTKQSGWLQRGRKGFSAKPGKLLSWKVGSKRFYAKSVGPAPARPIFPGKKLPASWSHLYRSAASKVFRSTIGNAA